MAPRAKTILASIALVLLTLGALNSFYWLAFSFWMTAYPYTNASEWRPRVYVWLATTIVIGLAWGALAVWLFRQRRRREVSRQ